MAVGVQRLDGAGVAEPSLVRVVVQHLPAGHRSAGVPPDRPGVVQLVEVVFLGPWRVGESTSPNVAHVWGHVRGDDESVWDQLACWTSVRSR
jgi:hypothetical protein